MDTPETTPQQARTVIRTSLAAVAALTTQVLQHFALAFEKTGEIDVAQLLALGKQIVEAGRELNRMDACEQRAAATALRRDQFETKKAMQIEMQAEQLRQMRMARALQEHAAGPAEDDAVGKRIYEAAKDYARHIEAARLAGDLELPQMPPELRQALVEAGMDPDNNRVQQELLEKMIESNLLAGLTLPQQAQAGR